MYSKVIKKNSRGFTLVEVIASIVILGIVVVSLLPFFPQVLGWSKATEDQLVASNLLSQVAYELKNDEGQAFLPSEGKVNFNTEYTVNNETYKPVVEIIKQTSEEEKLNLFKAKITIADKNTYVYLNQSSEEVGGENE